MKRRTCTRAGISIFEVLVAATVLVVALTALYAVYGQSLRALKYANESSAAELYLRSQVELLRNCGWATLSGTAVGTNFAIPTTILPDPTTDVNLKTLPNVVSQKMSVYPVLTSASPSPTAYYSTTRFGSGYRNSPVVIPAVTGSQSALTFLFNIVWTSQSTTFTKEYSAVLYNSNIE